MREELAGAFADVPEKKVAALVDEAVKEVRTRRRRGSEGRSRYQRAAIGLDGARGQAGAAFLRHGWTPVSTS